MVIPALIAFVSVGQANAGIITGGKFVTPSGVKVELIGFANSDSRVGPVYGANGKPLDRERVRQFVNYSEVKGYAENASSKAPPGSWISIFRVTGPGDEPRKVRLNMNFEFSMMGFIRPDIKKKQPDPALFVGAYHPKSGPFLDIPFAMPAGPYRQVASFGDDGATFEEGIFVQLKKSKLDGFAATEQESRAFTMDGYQGSALVPMSLKGMQFDLREAVRTPKPVGNDLATEGYAGAYEAGTENGSLKLQVFGRLPKAPTRSFRLYARPTLSFTMRMRLPNLNLP